jgi:hypothetical protein
MTKRLAVAFVSLLAVLAGATASPRTASAAPAGTTHPRACTRSRACRARVCTR